MEGIPRVIHSIEQGAFTDTAIMRVNTGRTVEFQAFLLDFKVKELGDNPPFLDLEIRDENNKVVQTMIIDPNPHNELNQFVVYTSHGDKYTPYSMWHEPVVVPHAITLDEGWELHLKPRGGQVTEAEVKYTFYFREYE